MRKSNIDVAGQQALFHNTTHGEQPFNFFGKYVKTKKHQTKLKNQAWDMINNYCDGEFWTTLEWIKNTNISSADRILRKIANGEFEGYGREEKRNTELGSKYRIVKLGGIK